VQGWDVKRRTQKKIGTFLKGIGQARRTIPLLSIHRGKRMPGGVPGDDFRIER
jgi:hypothetical protein